MKRNVNSQLGPINKKLQDFDSELKKDKLDFILKTLDGDDERWKDIRIDCDTVMANIKSLDEQISETILGDEKIGFRPPSSSSMRIEAICGYLDTRRLVSLIINDFTVENDLLDLIPFGDKTDLRYELIYRASRDGFDAASFHAKCDYKPGTLTIIRTTNGCIFGGYTAVEWTSEGGSKTDPRAFIFRLVYNHKYRPRLIPVNAGGKDAIFCKAAPEKNNGFFNALFCV